LLGLVAQGLERLADDLGLGASRPPRDLVEKGRRLRIDSDVQGSHK